MDEANKFIVLYPGKFKPFHDGYLSVLLSYMGCGKFDIDEIRVIVSKTPKDGIEAEDTLPFVEKVCQALSDKSGIWVHAVNTIGKSPYRDCSYEIREHQENDYTIASNYADSDEYDWIYEQFDNAQDYSGDVEKYVVNGGVDISSEDLKHYAKDGDYESFRKAFDTMVDELELVTDDDVREYFDAIASKVEFDDEQSQDGAQYAGTNESINTENNVNTKMLNGKNAFSINVTELKESCPNIRFNDMRDDLKKHGALVEGRREDNMHIMDVRNISESAFSKVLRGYGLCIDRSDETPVNEGQLYDEEGYPIEDEMFDCDCRKKELFDDDDLDECGIQEDAELDEGFSALLDVYNSLHGKRGARRRMNESKCANPCDCAKDAIKGLDVEPADRTKLLRRASAVCSAKTAERAKEELLAFEETLRQVGAKCPNAVSMLKKVIKDKEASEREDRQNANESINARVNRAIDKINEGKMLTERAKKKFARQRLNERKDNTEKLIKGLTTILFEGKIRNQGSPEELAQRIGAQMDAEKPYLYENTKVNGHRLKDLSLQTIKAYIMESAQTVKRLKMQAKRTINESASSDINRRLQRTRRLVSLLLEEYEYRKLYTTAVLHEKSDEPSTDDMSKIADMFSDDNFNFAPEPAEDPAADDKPADEKPEGDESNGDAPSEEDEDDGEEVELSGIVFTMKNKAAADELIASCKDAGIPEDAFEFVNEDAPDDESSSDDESDGDGEDADKGEDADAANEAFNAFAARYRALFEDEDADNGDDAPEFDLNGDDEGAADEGGDDADKDSDDDKPVKVRLVDTDYVNDVAKVLDDVYGITRDEFQDMIGGDILDSDDKGDGEEETKDDSKDGDDSETDSEEISNDDVFAGL